MFMISVFAKWMSQGSRVRNTLIYGLAVSSPQITITFLALLYVPKFTTREYGVYGILTAALALLSMLIDLGFSSAIVRNYYDMHADLQRSRAYLGSMLTGSGLVALALTPLGAVLLYSGRGALGFDGIQRMLVVVIVLAALFDRTSEAMGVVCQALERPGDYIAGRIAQALVSMVAGYLMVFQAGWGVPGAFVGIMAGKLASTVAYQRMLSRLGVTLQKPDWKAMRDCLSFGIPVVITRSAAWSRRVALRPTMIHVQSFSQVAIFSFGSYFAEIPGIIAPAIDMAITPIYYKRRVDQAPEFRERIRTFAALYAATLFPLWAGLLLFTPELLDLLAGPRYEVGRSVCALLLCASYVRMQSPFLIRQISYLRRTWIFPVLTIPCGILAIAFVLAFGKSMGLLAGGVAVLAAELLVMLGMAATVRRLEHVDFPVSTTLTLTGILGLFSLWIGVGQPAPVGWALWLIKGGVLFLSAALVLAFWGVPQRHFIRQLLRS